MQTELPVQAGPVAKIAVICVVILMDTIPKEYDKKVNDVLDFIAKNIRADLSLRKLATIAHFSPY